MESLSSASADKTLSSKDLHAHFDCFSGVAGDMLLASCLDATEDPALLLDHIISSLRKGLPEIADDFDIVLSRVKRGKMASIAALHVRVDSRFGHAPAPVPTGTTKDKESVQHSNSDSRDHSHDHNHHEGHDHNHDHIHSHNHSAKNSGTAGEGHVHSHEHSHSHPSSDEKTGPLRNLPQIRQMLETDAAMEYIDAWVRETAIAVFTELAQAEAKTHGADSCDTVHFHEVGASDSIVDTVGTLIALHRVGVKTFSCSRLPFGEGTIWSMHGLMPTPAPAALRLMEGLPVCPGPAGATGELCTPTGVSLLRVLTKSYRDTNQLKGRPPTFTIRRIGHGAGTKDFEGHPNIVRLILGDDLETK